MTEHDPPRPWPFAAILGSLTLISALLALACSFNPTNFQSLGWQGGFDRFGLKLLGIPVVGLALLSLLTSLVERLTQRGTRPLGWLLPPVAIGALAVVILTTTGR